MNRLILSYSLICSSFILGMDHAQGQLELLLRKIDEPDLTSSSILVTFKTTNKDHLPIITLSSPSATPDHIQVQLPQVVYICLSKNLKEIPYSGSLNKKQTINALEKLFNENNNKDDVNIVMSIHCSRMEKYRFLIETAELPQYLKDKCNITKISKTDIRNFYILVPLLCACSLIAYFS